MRISDWSSDVCSSDLDGLGADEAAFEVGVDDAGGLRRLGALLDRPGPRFLRPRREEGDEVEELVAGRSEEHTSELQSLMRISYAVFCLKKKIKQETQTTDLQ